MPEEFVSLAAYLRPPTSIESPPSCDTDEPARDDVEPEGENGALEAALSAVRRFHAGLADALDAALDELLCDVAAEVVARELELAPVDLSAIVARALERFDESEPLLLRVHPDETGALGAFGVPVVADASLRRADVLIELHSGTIDATLGARLELILQRRTLE